MANKSQRRNLLKDAYEKGAVGDELDHIHNELNKKDILSFKEVFQNYTVAPGDNIISCMNISLFIKLPNAARVGPGKRIVIKDGTFRASTGTITITAEELIDEDNQITITTDGGSRSLLSDGRRWLIV